jgi:DNA polymerase III alpha subunit
MYIELHAASAFSFLQGASLPEAIVERAANLGYDAIALVDRDGVYGSPRFYKAARTAGIKAIVGAELTLADAAIERASNLDSDNPQSNLNPQSNSNPQSNLNPQSNSNPQSAIRNRPGFSPCSWLRARATRISAGSSRA